ncbi:MAG TPA: Gfo/Idh/MocA family oxidoreductase [Tepidisphaeraceae bacterium]|nr:Gfo/Idh/MocA family oxidoreductase [Tepidisphaeraceae bacterium]
MIGVAIIGSGAIALANHLPGFAICPDTKVVALCDANPAVLEKARQTTGISAIYTDHKELLKRDDVNAVLVATPNVYHAPIALDAIAAGKHVMVEKPIAMNLDEAMRMVRAAEAANVRHMTAFTYRFVPAMRYMTHLVKSGAIGQPYHFRASRFQDWHDRNLGWRQVKKLAGSGEMGDMLSHRIDYGRLLIGEYQSLVADFRRFLDVRQGNSPSDLDDWVSMIVRFDAKTDGRPVTGVLESTKLATGRGEGHRGLDLCEVNGSEGTLAYTTQKPLELQIGNKNDPGLHTVKVPNNFLVLPGSPRDPNAGDPLATFRYDQDFEFIDAIRNQRPCNPSLLDGAKTQAIMDAALLSEAERRWVDVPRVG